MPFLTSQPVAPTRIVRTRIVRTRIVRRTARALRLPPAAFLAVALLVAAGCATSTERVPVDSYLRDVAWMADDARGGRDTASPGLMETAEYVAAAFAAAGLEPIGDGGGWMQAFAVPGRKQLGTGNRLTLAGEELELHEDWLPLSSSRSGSARGAAVFAGYGISDPEGGYDDYAGLDVTDKLVVVLRRGPRSREKGTRYGPNGPGASRTELLSKVNEAFRRGAAGLVIVNDPASTMPGGRRDRPATFRSSADGVAASLPAISLTAEAGTRFFAGNGLDLAELQQQIDAGPAPASRPLEGATASFALAIDRPEMATANVLGLLRGSDPALAHEYVLIGAHMDHIGLAEMATSRGGPEARGQIHNGADDNASGTAGLIGAARVLALNRHALPRSVVFAAWSGEERGLLGSKHFAESPTLPFRDLVVALNMDMIGRSVEGRVTVEGVGTAEGLGDLVARAQAALGLPLQLQLAPGASANSDHASFLDRQVPVLNFFTGLHEDYHMPGDDVEKINAHAGAAIASLAARVVGDLSRLPGRPTFAAAPGTGPRVAAADPHAGEAQGAGPDAVAPVSAYRVVLGTSPDMGYQAGDGVRLAGVRKDTPAERAGLKVGDRIVAFDGKLVRSLEDYSVLLFSRHPGDEVVIRVVRGAETLELKAVLDGHVGES